MSFFYTKKKVFLKNLKILKVRLEHLVLWRDNGGHDGVKRGRTQRDTTGGKEREQEKCHVNGG